MNDSAQDSRIEWSIRVDQLCDEFERAFRDQQVPQIPQFLERINARARGQLVVELVALEIDLLGESEEAPPLSSYIDQFPEYADDLSALEPGAFDSWVDHPSAETVVDSLTPPHPPSGRIDQFQLQSVLGQGAFGTVWKALDTKLQREVAIKIARQDRFGPGDLALLLHEARTAANLRHPNIVRVYDIREGSAGRPSYIVSELIHGATLKDSLPLRDGSPRSAARLISKIARALEHAHGQKIIHRDLKPGNILLDASGEPHVTDFGLAKWDAADDSFAGKGQLVGTPLYMAPEQAQKRHEDVDARTDVYALGVILYKLLTGVSPFRGSLSHLLEQIISDPPPRPRSIRSTIPVELEQICLKCLAKDRDLRYQSAGDLADDLDRFLNGEALRGVEVPLPRRLRRWAWRHRRFGAFTAGSLSLCSLVAAFAWWSLRPQEVRHPVKIETNPPGCEITAVLLDPLTGEPNPSQIEHAAGKTPLVTPLRPGDYLIVAVLDDLRFHEVLRHVPSGDEKAALFEAHTFWRRGDDDVIHWRSIEIPRQDVTLPMGFAEGAAGWNVSSPNEVFVGGSQIRIPPFYFDMADHRPENTLPIFGRLNGSLEAAGKRMPTAAELLYLQDAAAQPPSDVDRQLLRLPAETALSGLFALPWEWTITRAEITLSISQPSQRLRIQSAGASEKGDKEPRVRAQYEHTAEADIGIRGVRSARPRRTPGDFPEILSERGTRRYD